MKAVNLENKEISTVVTVCFKSFNDTLKAINSNLEMISHDEILYLSKIIPCIKSRLDTVFDKVDARLSVKGEPSNRYESPSNESDEKILFHKSPVKRSNQKPPPRIESKVDSKKSRRDEEHEVIEIIDNVEEETDENESSSKSKDLQIISSFFNTTSTSSDSTEKLDAHVLVRPSTTEWFDSPSKVRGILRPSTATCEIGRPSTSEIGRPSVRPSTAEVGRPSLADSPSAVWASVRSSTADRPSTADSSATRKEHRRTVFPGTKSTTNKSFSEGGDLNISEKWGKMRKTIFPMKIIPNEKKPLMRPSSAAPTSGQPEKPIRRISFPGKPREKEVRFLSPRRSSHLQLLTEAYDPSSTSWEDMARQAFKIIDLNGDGFLQKHEVIGAIEIMKQNGDMDKHANSAELAESMLSTFDSDGDGQMDIEEFISLMKNAGKSVVNHRMSALAHNVILNHQKRIENSIIGNDIWMIHPLGVRHAIWDILVSTLICITVVTMPLSLGWDELNDKFYEMNLVFDFIFLFDIGKNFCTGFVDENDAVIMDRKIVRWNYLTGFFLIDLLSSIPLDLIFKLAGYDGGTVSGTKRSLKLLKFVRMAKLIRLLRLNRLFQQIKNATLFLEEELHIRISDGFTKLLRLFVGALILAHWMGCFHFFLVRSHDFPIESWIVHAGLDDKEPRVQWTWSFFKALANMLMIGFETPPFTNTVCDEFTEWCAVEHWVTLGSLYLGAVFYSLLISSISSILAASSLARRRFDEKLVQIDDYMRSKKLPATLREKVKEYFHLQHTDGKLFNENEIHEMVTPFLSRQIKSFSGRDIKTRVPLFSSISNRRFTEEMVNAIEPSVAFTGDVILREDTTGDEMFFISNGIVELYFSNLGQNQPYMAIGDGCYLGEVSLLLGVKRIASARTKTQCMLYKITKKNLLRILQDFPETEEMMKSVAVCRKKRVDNYLDPMNNPLSPDETVDSEDAKTDIFGYNIDEITQEKEEEYRNSVRKKGHFPA